GGSALVALGDGVEDLGDLAHCSSFLGRMASTSAYTAPPLRPGQLLERGNRVAPQTRNPLWLPGSNTLNRSSRRRAGLLAPVAPRSRMVDEMATILDPFPRVALACLPTPLEPLPRLSEFLGGPRILVKRDDQTGLALGGNKVRKLEFLAGQALAQGCDTLVTIGGVQSNHARQTAAAAARLGMQCELVLPRVVPRASEEYEQSGNVLLDRLLGARLRVLSAEQNSSSVLDSVAKELRARGRKALRDSDRRLNSARRSGLRRGALRAARSDPRR